MPNNVPDTAHPVVGSRMVYRPFDPHWTDPAVRDDSPGALVVGNGMAVEVRALFRDWNGIDGLTMFNVWVPETGLSTHLSERELDFFLIPEPARWVHDPQRDGAGCGWCGSFAQVDSDNLCRECFG